MQIEMNHAIRDPKQGQTPTTIARLSTAFREALTDLPTLDTKPTREQDAPAPNIDKVRESEKKKAKSSRTSERANSDREPKRRSSDDD